MLGTLFTVAFLKHESEREILADIRQTERRRVELDRHRLASSIEFSRAIVDPAWLSTEIKEIHDLHRDNAPTAEARLDGLIDELRRRVSTSAPPKPTAGSPP